MEAYQKNYIVLKMNQDELDELNEFLDEEVHDGDFIDPLDIDEEWLNEFGLFFENYNDIDSFIIVLTD